MIKFFGYIATFLAAYNIICGMVQRFANNDEAARASGLEAAIWFIAATVAFK